MPDRDPTVVETHVAAPPERVFAVLADADSYGDWVVGASHIRGADPAYPAPGTRFHHVQGVGRLGLHDQTVVLASEPPRHLRLHVMARPLVRAEVDLQLTPSGGGTHVRMAETIVGGLQRLAPAAVNAAFLKLRNGESLRRLRRLAERG